VTLFFSSKFVHQSQGKAQQQQEEMDIKFSLLLIYPLSPVLRPFFFSSKSQIHIPASLKESHIMACSLFIVDKKNPG
jgi:hypothetical protein